MAHACLATSSGWQRLSSRDVSHAHQIKVWRWSLRCSTPSAATGFYNVAYRNIKLYYLRPRRRLLPAVKLATVWNVQSHPVVAVLWRDRRSMPVRAEWAGPPAVESMAIPTPIRSLKALTFSTCIIYLKWQSLHARMEPRPTVAKNRCPALYLLFLASFKGPLFCKIHFNNVF